jgi:urease subunit beta
MIPGEMRTAPGDIELNAGRPTDHAERHQQRRPADPGRLALSLLRNQRRAGVRPRAARLAARHPAGTAVRFEPGQTRSVQLVALAGERIVHGFNGR